MQVKINSYISVDNLTEEQAVEHAISMVNAYDTINESRLGEVVTKLYYIVPVLGKIIVVVNEADKEILGVDSNILANTNISEYPLERLPASVIEYKELIVKVGSSLTMEQIFNAGQSIVEDAAEKVMPYKIPVLKVINYNNTDTDALVMPGVFGDNIFSSVSGIVNSGNAEAGDEVIESSERFYLDMLPVHTGIVYHDGIAVALTYRDSAHNFSTYYGNGAYYLALDGLTFNVKVNLDGSLKSVHVGDRDRDNTSSFSEDPENQTNEFVADMSGHHPWKVCSGFEVI